MSKNGGPHAPASSRGAGMAEATTVRFRAPNGASVAVTVGQQAGPDPQARALVIAREAVAQVAGGDQIAARKNPAPQDRKVDCGENFWSWAMPEGWPR